MEPKILLVDDRVFEYSVGSWIQLSVGIDAENAGDAFVGPTGSFAMSIAVYRQRKFVLGGP